MRSSSTEVPPAGSGLSSSSRRIQTPTHHGAAEGLTSERWLTCEEQSFVDGERDLQRLTASGSSADIDENQLFQILVAAYGRVQDWQRSPPMPKHANAVQPIALSILNLCSAWFRLTAAGHHHPGEQDGLRGSKAANMVCSMVASLLAPLLASDFDLADALMPAFSENGGLGLFGSSLCHFNEALLPSATKKLRRVALKCSAFHPSAEGCDGLATNIEAFRTGFITRLVDELSPAPNRVLRVHEFKELLADMSDVFGIVYSNAQVFSMGCVIALNLARRLTAFCPGVEPDDAVAAMDWLASVMRGSLQQSPSPTSSPIDDPDDGIDPQAIREQLREWIDHGGLWGDLLLHSGCSTIDHAKHLFKLLLENDIFSIRELVESLQQYGAFPPSHITVTNRLAMQQALLIAVASRGTAAMVSLFVDLCDVFQFEHLDQEGIDLMVRVTQQALAAGHQPAKEVAWQGPSLAFAHLLRFLQWGYGQCEPPKKQLDFAHRALLHTLSPHPAFVPLISRFVVEALNSSIVSAFPRDGRSHDHLRCVSALGNVAVDAARTGVAAAASVVAPEAAAHLTADAMARLCSLLRHIPSDENSGLSSAAADVWLSAFVDTFCCYLRLPGAQLDSSQVDVLWKRFISSPVFGLPVLSTASHYFKLALLVQPNVREALLVPLRQMAEPSPEIHLVHTTIFCSASLVCTGIEPPPLTADFFFPLMSEARSSGSLVKMVVSSEPVSPEKNPPSRNSAELSVATCGMVSNENDLVADAASVGISLSASSAATPLLRLNSLSLETANQQLLQELAGYHMIERRLWDEFGKLGRIDDVGTLKQRNMCAERCRHALQSMRDGSGDRLPPVVAEAHAKFSLLCQNIAVPGLEARSAQRLQVLEEARAVAEDGFLQARAAHERELALCRRRGKVLQEGTTEMTTAKDDLKKANVQLVIELRSIAARAQLGLVELLGTPLLARCLRVTGAAACDPLLAWLTTTDAWLTAQAETNVDVPELPSLDPFGKADAAPGAPDAALDDPALARPDGLAGYTDIRPISAGGHVCLARRHGDRHAAVFALKGCKTSAEAALKREMQALCRLRQSCVVPLLGIIKGSRGPSHLELGWCGGGNLHEWCIKHPTIVGGEDAEVFVKALGIFRQVWHAIAFVHSKDAVHGDLALPHVLLTAEHRPVLADFGRCFFKDSDVASWSQDESLPTAGYEAPETAELSKAGARMVPTQEADTYAAGVMMAKAFLGLGLEVSACQVDARTGRRDIPDESIDADLADLLQGVIEQRADQRLPSSTVPNHRALDPAPFLRRQGLLGASGRAAGLLGVAEQLREDFRGRRVDDMMSFTRDTVFDAIADSKIFQWAEEALLGEWRVMLDGETGVDAGGLRREVVTLFFEQLEQSKLVERVGADSPGIQPTLFIQDRLKADRSPQQWRQTWSAVGAMILRSVVHFGNAPVIFSSAVFDCAFGRIGRLPPDEGIQEQEEDGGVDALGRLRDTRGDDWARSELNDFLQRLRRADPQKDTSYRWVLEQRSGSTDDPHYPTLSYSLSSENLETVSCMLGSLPYQFLVRNSHQEKDGSISHAGAVLEWALLWDIYLKYLGDGDRWTAYEALALGLTARGRRLDLWTHSPGQKIVNALEGAELTPDIVMANLEYKPGYGYDKQIQFFINVLRHFTAPELSMFLRFATGIGRLPANQKFPNGQKLTIRFLPDSQDRLPSAHTCFWTVDVPPYEDELDLEQKLRQAIAAPQPFTFS